MTASLLKQFPRYFLWAILVTGSVYPFPVNAQTSSSLAIRAIQTRSFDTQDQKKLINTIISTLQDMGYFIGRIDVQSGFVNATRLEYDTIEMTITVRPYQNELLVRASARINDLPIDHDPAFYQNFFDHLAQASFLNAHKIY